MYPTVLLVHSWLRWAVLLAGVVAVIRGAGGWSGVKAWTAADDRAGFWFVTTLDVQMLLGLLLYLFLSPFGLPAWADIGETMRHSGARFWAVEHTFGMIAGIVLAHVGRARARRAAPQRKHRTAAIFYGLALVAIVASIPWPGMPAGRELFRGI